MKRKSLRGAAIALTMEVVRGVLVVIYLAVIARLLTPADFGVVAAALAVVWILQPLSGLSLLSALVQTSEINERKLNAAFWWSLGLAVALTIVTLFAAPLLGKLFGMAEVVGVTRVLALNFLITGLSTVPFALLHRELRFGVVSILELVGLIVSAAAAIALAVWGFSYWALVWHELVLYVSMAAGAWVAARWRPRSPRRLENISALLSYGAYFSAFRVLRTLRGQADRLIVGRLGSAAALGSYSTASNLLLRIMQRINGPISSVAVSSLSRLQDMPQAFRDHYRLAILWSTSLSLPVASFVALEPRLVVTGLLGTQWAEAIPIFRILAIGAVAVLLRPSAAWVFRSIGRTDRQLRWGIVETTAYLAAFVLGARWGVTGIAIANAVVSYLNLVPLTLYSFRHSPVGVADLMAGLWRPAMSVIVTGLVWWMLPSLPTLSDRLILELVTNAAAFLAIFALLWLVLPGGRREAIDALRTTFGQER